MERPIWEPRHLDREGFAATALGGDRAVRRHAANAMGRDFVVGDIHGAFPELARAMGQLEFDLGRDRLFSVGDLIDRGPDSEAALEWLEQPWFLPVRGNHEQMLLDAVADPRGTEGEESLLWRVGNGGEWWDSVSSGRQERFAEAFAAIPLAREVECDRGLVGIVHADVPEDRDWEEFVEALRQGSREDCYHALWSRRRVSMAGGLGVEPPDVEGGVEMVLCGHTRVVEPMLLGNVWMIDTGAAYGGGMRRSGFTIAAIHPKGFRLHFHPTEPDGVP